MTAGLNIGMTAGPLPSCFHPKMDQYYEAADSEPASTVPHRGSRILGPLVFRTQRLLLFKRSNNTRTHSTEHNIQMQLKTIGCNITVSK